MLYKTLNNLTAIQITQLIITTNTARKKHALTILQLHARPSYYHYNFYHWAILLWNAMPNILIEAESLHVFKVELAMQKIPVLSNY